MNPPHRDPPLHVRSLNKRIDNLASDRGVTVGRIQRVIANTVVGQLLGAGVAKGGTGIKLRVGEAASRFTPDFDAARHGMLEAFLDEFEEKLNSGWGQFSGRLVEKKPASPEGIPESYVMLPFEIKLNFAGRSWRTVPFELGHDEIGDTDKPDLRLAPDITELFAIVGLPSPDPVPVIPVNHQIAQKLHACTGSSFNGPNERAHDLVDLQILDTNEDLDLAGIDSIAQRLFISRRMHSWPPRVVHHDGWESLYEEAALGLDVHRTLSKAIEWANSFIRDIVAAQRS